MNDPAKTDTLIEQLSSGDRGRQRAAVITLAELKDRRAVPALIALLRTVDDVWGAAADAATALGEIGDPSSVDALIDALDHPYAGGKAIEALARIQDDRALIPIIERFEQSHDPSLATILGNWGDARAVLPLIEAMTSRSPRVRFYSARALGKIGDKRAIPVLEKASREDTKPLTGAKSFRGKSVSYVAARALARLEADEPEHNT